MAAVKAKVDSLMADLPPSIKPAALEELCQRLEEAEPGLTDVQRASSQRVRDTLQRVKAIFEKAGLS